MSSATTPTSLSTMVRVRAVGITHRHRLTGLLGSARSDGTAYVTRCDVDDPVSKIYGIYSTQIDLVTGRLLTPDRLISTGYLPNNATARPEGPHGATVLEMPTL